MNELMVIKQLPIIEENLKILNSQITRKIEWATSFVCSENTVKEIKKMRAELNTQFNELEGIRKRIKNQILEPYENFKNIYNEHVLDLFKAADTDLKNKIDSVENELKKQKKDEIESYFLEWCRAYLIDFIKFEQLNINVTLTASIKSLKNQVKEFIDKINKDLDFIEVQEFKEEILVEYKQNLNVTKSISDVLNRKKLIELEKVKQEEIKKNLELEKEKEEEKTKQEQGKFLKLEKPKEVKEQNITENITTEILCLNFKVWGTREELKNIKNYMIEKGLKYE